MHIMGRGRGWGESYVREGGGGVGGELRKRGGLYKRGEGEEERCISWEGEGEVGGELRKRRGELRKRRGELRKRGGRAT